MVDKITKTLNKLTPKEKRKMKSILLQVEEGSFDGLDIVRLKGRNDISDS